jgi:hypothetical protein
MTSNVGNTDRILRFVAGIALFLAPMVTSWALFDSALMKYGAIIIGAVLMVTALMRFCPAYSIFGMNTCPLSGSKK